MNCCWRYYKEHCHLLSLSRFFFLLSSGNQIAALSQMSWLMKTAAIELRVTSLNRQRSHTQRLVSLLLDDQPHTQHTGISCLSLFNSPWWAHIWNDKHLVKQLSEIWPFIVNGCCFKLKLPNTMTTQHSSLMHQPTYLIFIFVLADGESGMEEETRSVSGFLHFDTVSKGLFQLSRYLDQIYDKMNTICIQAVIHTYWFCLLLILSSFHAISAQEAAECAGHHRLQSGHARTAAAWLLRTHSNRAGDLQLWARQWARTHSVQREGGSKGWTHNLSVVLFFMFDLPLILFLIFHTVVT